MKAFVQIIFIVCLSFKSYAPNKSSQKASKIDYDRFFIKNRLINFHENALKHLIDEIDYKLKKRQFETRIK